MTTDMINFRDLVEKAPVADLLREMIGYAAERLMGDDPVISLPAVAS